MLSLLAWLEVVLTGRDWRSLPNSVSAAERRQRRVRHLCA